MGQIAQQLHKTLKGSSIVIEASAISEFIGELEKIKNEWEDRMSSLEDQVKLLAESIKKETVSYKRR